MILGALTAEQIDQGPAVEAATAALQGFLVLGLTIFSAFFALRVARRLLGA